MMNLQRRYLMLAALILAFTGCDKLIYDQQVPDDGGPAVYLNINTRAAHTNGGESINTDGADYEDHIHDLALLIFDSGTGVNRIGEPYFKENLGSGVSAYAFTAELTAGKTYDFYFVANLPALKSTLEGITTKGDMDSFMGNLHDLAAVHYSGAEPGNSFPMARVYRNQVIPTGGTIYQPTPFKPKYTQGGTIATLTESGTVTEEPFVLLVRAVAKLELVFSGADLGIAEVKYHNAFRQYSLVEQESTIVSPTYNADATLSPEVTGGSTYIYYMPEVLLPSSTAWAGSGDNKPVNYFSVKTTDGTITDVPIVSHGVAGADPNVEPVRPYDNYLDFATGKLTEKPDYNIYRNRHYKFTIKNLQKIEIFYEIDPWVKVNKSLYMGFGYNVEVDGTNITVSNTIQACAPHKVILKTVSPYLFEDDSDTKVFDTLDTTASELFTLKTEPDVGDEYLQVYYNEGKDMNGDPQPILVKTFTKK